MEITQQKELLRLLEMNSREDLNVIAKMLNISLEELKNEIQQLESSGILLKYTTIINWDKVDPNHRVTAVIDVKVTPKREVGFDDVARRIYQFPEVKSVYLMSGAYDLSLIVEGLTLREVAQFVSEKLSTIDS